MNTTVQTQKTQRTKKINKSEPKQVQRYSLQDFIRDECSRDEEFNTEWHDTETERLCGLELVKARNRLGLTQSELSQKTGIAQGDISKIESANANPSLKTLKRLACAMDCKVRIILEPN